MLSSILASSTSWNFFVITMTSHLISSVNVLVKELWSIEKCLFWCLDKMDIFVGSVLVRSWETSKKIAIFQSWATPRRGKMDLGKTFSQLDILFVQMQVAENSKSCYLHEKWFHQINIHIHKGTNNFFLKIMKIAYLIYQELLKS